MEERNDRGAGPDPELTERMLKKRLYVVFTTAIKPMSEMVPILPEHMHYLIDLEKQGTLFASGPLFAEDHEVSDSGMTILRADSQAEAEAIAQSDPLYKNGMRTYEIKAWQLNEGSYTVTVNYSDQSYHMS